MKAFVFPGQAAQFVGMGKDFESSPQASLLLKEANYLMGFDIGKIMSEGSEEDLKQTNVTQPAVFLHSIIKLKTSSANKSFQAVAGHSLGEFTALVANGVLSFADGLKLVKARAQAMQKACEAVPGTMAAIVGLEDAKVEEICESTDGIVVAANYNCPGQLVISGEHRAVKAACARLSEAGARRAILLPVGGAFHSPLMQPAQEELAAAIESVSFQQTKVPIYQNVSGLSYQDPQEIRKNLVKQLTSPVRWTDTIERMIADGAEEFVEVGGTGKVLLGMIKRISRETNSSTL